MGDPFEELLVKTYCCCVCNVYLGWDLDIGDRRARLSARRAPVRLQQLVCRAAAEETEESADIVKTGRWGAPSHATRRVRVGCRHDHKTGLYTRSHANSDVIPPDGRPRNNVGPCFEPHLLRRFMR